ncbi:MAG: radial spoke head 1-like protein [uncultured bacterium]|nr:MAG: radial spoke head 1-like protein [uncultured bacterium]
MYLKILQKGEDKMFSKIKYMVIGAVVACGIMGSVSFGEDAFYKLTEMKCDIWVGNKIAPMDSPVLNYDGRAYLPLRKVGELLGAEIKWNDANRIVDITPKTKEVVKEIIKEVPKALPPEFIPNPNPITTVNYNNGDKYEGTIVENKLHGYGKYTWSNGDCYIGEWNTSNRTGRGIYYFNNGSVSAGEWTNGILTKEVTKEVPIEKIVYVTVTPTPTQIPTTINTQSNIVAPLKLFSNDGKFTYLGKVTSNTYDSESIFNEYGSYGGKYSSTSIFNEYGNYGGKYSSYSAFNEYTSTPPIIIDANGKNVGKITMNKYLTGAISPFDIKATLINLGF